MNVYIIRSRFARMSSSFGESYSVPNLTVLLTPSDVLEYLMEVCPDKDYGDYVVECWRVGATEESYSCTGTDFAKEFAE